MTLKSFFKKIIYSNIYFYNAHLTLSLIKQKRNFTKKVKNSNFETKLNARLDVVNKVIERKRERRSNVCHIIGSGWSLNSSIASIKENDFVIGFNYAALTDIKFDTYFFEFGGEKIKTISLNHLTLANKVSENTNIIFFKNILEPRNEIDFIEKNWSKKAMIIKDRYYFIADNKFTNFVINKVFNDNSSFFPQVCSTVVTATTLAYQAGFNKIVIHGLDFGGKYFYEESISLENTGIILDKKEQGFYGKTDESAVHSTALGVGMKHILPEMYSFLKSRNVELFCATYKSPSSSFIPVYEN